MLCAGCAALHITSKRQTCFRCNRLSDGGKTCKSCRPSTALFSVTVAAHYDGLIQEGIWKLKYDRSAASAQALANILAPRLHNIQADIITCVPTSPSRYRVRGYNQAELLAKIVSKELGVPYKPLLARMHSRHQVGLSRIQRLAQVEDLFAMLPRVKVGGSRVLIVDDVITTGATLSACAAILKQAGAKRVLGAAVAKH